MLRAHTAGRGRHPHPSSTPSREGQRPKGHIIAIPSRLMPLQMKEAVRPAFCQFFRYASGRVPACSLLRVLLGSFTTRT